MLVCRYTCSIKREREKNNKKIPNGDFYSQFRERPSIQHTVNKQHNQTCKFCNIYKVYKQSFNNHLSVEFPQCLRLFSNSTPL